MAERHGELLALGGVQELLGPSADQLEELEVQRPGTDEPMRVVRWNVNG